MSATGATTPPNLRGARMTKPLKNSPADTVPPDLLVLTEAQAARLLGVSVFTLRRMRKGGTGPKVLQLSDRRIGYRKASLEAWLTELEVAS